MNITTKEQKQCVIMGDMNIDLLKFESQNKTERYLDNIFSNGFIPIIVKPTRICSSTATLIDHIYTNNISTVGQSGIIITDVADHFGIFHIATKKVAIIDSNVKYIRHLSEAKIQTFKLGLELLDFTDILSTLCPNESYNKFIKLYTELFEKIFPLREYKHNSKHLKKEPWFTAGLLTEK